MTRVTITRDGFDITFRLPKGVTVEEFTGALAARESAPLVGEPPKGRGAGAKSAPVRRVTGAPLAPLPSQAGSKGQRNKVFSVEYYRDEIKALTAERGKLTPYVDAHEALRKRARDQLLESHKSAPLFAGPEISAVRLALHDRILESSIKNGWAMKPYKEMKTMIEAMTRELQRLLAKKPVTA